MLHVHNYIKHTMEQIICIYFRIFRFFIILIQTDFEEFDTPELSETVAFLF